MEIVTKNGKSRLADVNELDFARILLYAGRHHVIPLRGSGTREPFVKRTQIIWVENCDLFIANSLTAQAELSK